VHGLAQQCGGFIELQSAPGHGTTFEVYLAASAETRAVKRLSLRADLDPLASRGETVLVVDDSDSVRAMLTRTLERAGYHVLSASDGDAGARLFRQHQGEIQLVVSDAVMPQRGGQDMHDEIVALQPTLRFLVCSGYTAEMFADDFFDHPYRAYLAKPFKPEQLLRAVRSLLEAEEKDSIRPSA